mgnify:CR=1 FL=1
MMYYTHTNRKAPSSMLSTCTFVLTQNESYARLSLGVRKKAKPLGSFGESPSKQAIQITSGDAPHLYTMDPQTLYADRLQIFLPILTGRHCSRMLQDTEAAHFTCLYKETARSRTHLLWNATSVSAHHTPWAQLLLSLNISVFIVNGSSAAR